MAPIHWIRMMEQIATQKLLETPGFHRAVERFVKASHRLRYGTSPEELGGTNMEKGGPGFGQHFVDEIRTQLGTTPKERAKAALHEVEKDVNAMPDGNAETAWSEIQQRANGTQTRAGASQKQVIESDYAAALRAAIKGTKASG